MMDSFNGSISSEKDFLDKQVRLSFSRFSFYHVYHFDDHHCRHIIRHEEKKIRSVEYVLIYIYGPSGKCQNLLNDIGRPNWFGFFVLNKQIESTNQTSHFCPKIL